MILQSPLAVAKSWFGPKVLGPAKADYELIARARDFATKLSNLSDTKLVETTADLRQRVLAGESVTSDAIVEPAFAVALAAIKRVMSIDLYDVQLLGGLALCRGKIAEMQTGEGKTFTALLPSYLHALPAAGVHVMTVNAYLAERDYEELASVFPLLGMSVGLVQADMSVDDKRTAYACDITYGPGYEFGFDYLRDQVALIARPKPRLGESFRARQRGTSEDAPRPMQRGQAAAIVDEADSVMLDEAMTPLVMATGSKDPAPNTHVYLAALKTADELEIDRDFVIDEAAATLQLTAHAVQRFTDQPNLAPRGQLDRSWTIYVEQALRAERLFRRDVDYVVDDGTIRLVDQYTGRIFEDRSWHEGLHQAVQAKEGILVTTENKTLARITRQRYLMRYKHLCGMTGTAEGGELELQGVYGQNVTVIPPNRPSKRNMLPAQAFGDLASKEQAIVEDIIRVQLTGQPVLVGTTTIDSSMRLVELLDQRGMSYQLLNGKQDAEESEIVAQAGQRGAVTIATNMAGRGTDIKLGPGVHELGGLHVIATEPQESTRIDRQLYGRAARQGDPGSCQRFASSEDELFTRYAPSLSARMRRLADDHGRCHVDLSHDVAAVQQRVETIKSRQRRDMFAHDDWLESVLKDLV
jgi:preprotein translocase subunit SecA